MVVGVSAANVNDAQALRSLSSGYRPSDHAAAHVGDTPTRSGPTRRANRPATWRGYASATSLRGSPRPGVESSERLGRHRWKIERSNSWLFGYRRLAFRYERKGSYFLTLLGLATAMTCHKKPAKAAT
ncbi:hypothetical protein [Streptomyces carpaticus]|uniref:hypothetical protein n=1 Tax=Streptomyces carpaticus TaxID=285558 RepID=UPI0035C1571C